MKKIVRVSSIFTANLLFVISTLTFCPVLGKEEIKKNYLGIEYLNKIPENDYILGPGDLIEVLISRDYPELTTFVTVDGEGTIYLPKIHRTYVEGLSLNELNDLLNKRFIEYVKYPNVEIRIINHRPIRVYVDGEVANPGLITISGAISLNSEIEDYDSKDLLMQSKNNYFPTVFDAIRKAGGITQFSNLTKVELVRINKLSDGGGKKKTILNFQNVIIKGDNSQNIRIYDGDFITINKSDQFNLKQLSKSVKSNLNPKFINVFVSGRVRNPGPLKITKSSTLNDAIDMSGGAKVLKGKTRFIRFLNDGTIDKRKITYRKENKRGSYSNPFLTESDLIIIDDNALTLTNEVVTDITGPFTGILSTFALIEALNN